MYSKHSDVAYVTVDRRDKTSHETLKIRKTLVWIQQFSKLGKKTCDLAGIL